MWSRCIAAAAGAVATRRRAYAANDDEGTPATTLVGAGAFPNYSLRLSIVHFALILHAAAGPSGRVSPIDSSGSRSIRTGASIPVAPPVKQKTLESFFAANSARTVVAADKPVVSVVASQVMDVGNRWWDSDEDEEVQIDDEAENIERMKRANESAQAWAKFFLRVTPQQMILCRTNSKSTNTLNFNRGEHMTACCATTPEGFKTAMPVFYLLKGANITFFFVWKALL